jgi:hypothetical protein
MAALPPRDPGRRGAGIAGIVLVVLALILLWPLVAGPDAVAPLGGAETVDVPPRGRVAPVFAPDGRPVFVLHDAGGEVRVIDAISSHHPWGFDDLVGWCAPTEEFVEWAHGVHFDAEGNRLVGPAPYGLAPFAYDVVSRDAAGDPATITIDEAMTPPPGGRSEEGDYAYCPDGHGGTVPLVAHAFGSRSIYETPADAVSAEPEGYVAVRGTLLVRSVGTGAGDDEPWAQLCAEIVDGQCVDGAIVINIDAPGLLVNVLEPAPGTAYEEKQVYLTRVRDGVLLGLGIVPPDQVRTDA